MTHLELIVDGHVVLIDADDLELVSQYQWRFARGYVCTKGRPDVSMHRLLCDPGELPYVDHINLNKLDNRRQNLRPCTRAKSAQNRGLPKNNTVGFKGVSRRCGGRFEANIYAFGRPVSLGTFDTPQDAAAAYDAAAIRLHGEFAKTNVSLGLLEDGHEAPERKPRGMNPDLFRALEEFELGHSLRSVAKKLGLSEGAVKSRVFRAREALGRSSKGRRRLERRGAASVSKEMMQALSSGDSYAQVAAKFSVPIGTVKSAVHRGRKEAQA